MFGSNLGRLLVIFFIVKSTISAVGFADDITDLENVGSTEDKGSMEKYDEMEPLSVLKKTETMKIITNKTYELKIYSKKDEKMDKESVGKSNLIAKLFISSATKFMKDGKQVGPVKNENRTVLLDGDEVPIVVENIPDEEKETNHTEALPAAANNTGSATSSETDSSEETEKEPENVKEETEKEGESPITSAQPSAMVPSKVVTEPKLPDVSTASSSNSKDDISDYISQALRSAAVGVFGPIFNNIILLLPFLIGLSFI